MRIKAATFYIEQGTDQIREVNGNGGLIVPAAGVSGIFTHSHGIGLASPPLSFKSETALPTYTATLRLETDGPLDAYTTYTSGYDLETVTWEAKTFLARYSHMLIGVDAFDREYVWQCFWMAQRFLYTGRQLLELIDRMLWDLASRSARLPVYKLLGAARERLPAYCNIGGTTIDALVADGIRAKDRGFKGCKDHSYRGVIGNSQMARELRAALGDDFLLFHDPVESYTYEEAVRVGRVMEKMNYQWIEEPLQDHDLMGLKKLCATLDLPVLALEWIGAIGGQPYNTAPYLALQAADIVRQRGIGFTGQIKQAQLAETFGVPVHGGDPQVILAISNDPVFEAYMGERPRPPEEELDCRGTLVIEDGYMSIAWNNRPAEEPDWDEIARRALCVI